MNETPTQLDITQLPLDQKLDVRAGINAPIVAHIRMLHHIYGLQHVPDDVKEAVLDHAIRYEKDLRTTIEDWNKGIQLDMNGEIGGLDAFVDTPFSSIITTIALSYGEVPLEEHHLREEFLKESFHYYLRQQTIEEK